MSEPDFEKDALLLFLTDALHAGPASPQWRQAVERLREAAGRTSATEEFAVLMEARQRLEQGKDYRSIRANSEFTRSLLDKMSTANAKRASTTGSVKWMILMCGGAVIISVAVAALRIWHSVAENSATFPHPPTLLIRTLAEIDFNLPPSPDWQVFGSAKPIFTRGQFRLSPAPAPSNSRTSGIVWGKSIAPSGPFSAAVAIRVRKIDPDIIAELFITDDSNSEHWSAGTAREWAVSLQGTQVRALSPGGQIEAESSVEKDFKGSIGVRMTLDTSRIVIQQGEKTLFTGPAGMDDHGARFVGVRLTYRTGLGADIGISKLHIDAGS